MIGRPLGAMMQPPIIDGIIKAYVTFAILTYITYTHTVYFHSIEIELNSKLPLNNAGNLVDFLIYLAIQNSTILTNIQRIKSS